MLIGICLLQTVTKCQVEIIRFVVTLSDMQSKSRQLLSIVLTVLLIMAPLGSVFAATPSLGHEAGELSMHAMYVMVGDTSSTADAMPAGCDHCANDCCAQGNCTSGSCGTCTTTNTVAYLSTLSYPDANYASAGVVTTLSRTAGSPFRPPRA